MVGEARPVTLTGPGGIGKTRLAVAVGERLRDRFGVGMAFVPLAAVTDPGLLLGSVALAGAADGLRRRAGLRTWPYCGRARPS